MSEAPETYYTKGMDAEYFEKLSDKDFVWALTCAAQDLNDSDENVSKWMPVAALLDNAGDRIASLEAANAALRRAIMGKEPDPSVSHGQFLEMARTLHDACDGGRIRAEAAEAALARLRVLAQNQGVMDANEITRLEAALSAERKKVERLGKALKKIEYVLQKDSLTQAERISSAFSVVRAALDEAAPSALDKERQT